MTQAQARTDEIDAHHRSHQPAESCFLYLRYGRPWRYDMPSDPVEQVEKTGRNGDVEVWSCNDGPGSALGGSAHIKEGEGEWRYAEAFQRV